MYKEGRNNILQLILTYFKWQFTKQFRFLGLSLFAEKITMAINVCTTIFNISHLIEFVSCSNAYNTACPTLREARKHISSVFSLCLVFSNEMLPIMGRIHKTVGRKSNYVLWLHLKILIQSRRLELFISLWKSIFLCYKFLRLETIRKLLISIFSWYDPK